MSRSDRDSHAGGRTGAIVMALGAVLLVGLSLPRLVAAIDLMPGDQIKGEYRRYTDGERSHLTGNELDHWQASRVAALGVVASPQSWGDIGFIALVRAAQATAADRPALRMAGRDALERALHLSPANGFYWFHLAKTDVNLGATAAEILHAVRSSIMVAPYQPAILEGRILLIFENWDVADEELRRMALEQASYLPSARRAGAFENLARLFPERVDDLRLAANGHRGSLRAIERGISQD